jgi:NAD(P)-dependent dehydrogenase (short-subunit alcohol dehydrogenase family)
VPSELFDLSGKVALVTGATRGIGLAIALEMARAGASIALSSESPEDVAATEHEMAGSGFSARGFPCDVRDEAAVTSMVRSAVAHFGGIDIVVCNAGVTGAPGPFSTMDIDNFDRVMAINLRSMIVLTTLVLPEIVLRGGGSVILMSSISGLRGNGNINAYALAKAGVAQLARNLAVEWGPGNVRVNAISPGLIRTPLSAPLLADANFMARRLAMTPLRRPGEAREVAGAAVFLASDAGAFVTGHNLVVDGGTVISDGS